MKRKHIPSDRKPAKGLISTAVLFALPGILIAQQTGTTGGDNAERVRAGVVEIRTPISTEFGTYVPYKIPVYEASVGYSEPGLRPDLSNVVAPQGGFSWEGYFSASDRAALVRDRVAVRPERMGSFAQAYAGMNGTPAFAPFITTDAAMAGLHATVEESFRRARRDYLAPSLRSVLDGVSRSLDNGLSAESDPGMKEAYQRLLAWTETARLLLDPAAAPHGSVADEVRAELRKIDAGSAAASTVLPDRRIDYGMFAPEGASPAGSELENYRRARIWLSRVGLQLRGSNGEVRTVEARMAAILARSLDMMGGREKNALNTVVALEGFFGGRDASALTADAVAASMRAYYGFQYSGSVSYLSDNGSLDRLVGYTAGALPENMRGNGALTMQLMPRESSLSASLFATLQRIAGNRSGASGQILAAALKPAEGSEPKDARTLRSTLARLPMEDWVQDFEWTTLYTAQLLAGNDQSNGLPKFMQSAGWKERKMRSALGAWSAAANGPGLLADAGRSAAAETTRFAAAAVGYVEPDPVAWSAIASQARYIREGLTEGAYGSLINAPLEEKLRDIENSAARFARIAALELSGRELTAEQENLIAAAPQRIAAWESFIDPSLRGSGALLAASAPERGGSAGPATGHPAALYVIAPAPDNPRELVLLRGAVYTYYETGMDKEEWVRAVTSGDAAGTGAYAVPASEIRPVSAKLDAVTAAVESGDRKGTAAVVQVELESNVVRRSSGAVWYTVYAPGYDGADVVTTVVDAAGRSVFQSFPLPIENGQRYDMVPTEDLKSGHYFIRVSDITGRTLASGRFLLMQ